MVKYYLLLTLYAQWGSLHGYYLKNSPTRIKLIGQELSGTLRATVTEEKKRMSKYALWYKVSDYIKSTHISLPKARRMANFGPNERRNSNIILFHGRKLVNCNCIYHSLLFRSANLWFSPLLIYTLTSSKMKLPKHCTHLLLWAQNRRSQSFQQFITSRYPLPDQPDTK